MEKARQIGAAETGSRDRHTKGLESFDKLRRVEELLG